MQQLGAFSGFSYLDCRQCGRGNFDVTGRCAIHRKRRQRLETLSQCWRIYLVVCQSEKGFELILDGLLVKESVLGMKACWVLAVYHLGLRLYRII